MSKNKRLVGAKDILRYLREKHDIRIVRSTLWKLMQRTGPSRFPAALVRYLGGNRVVAESANIDAWVRVHAIEQV